jgi:hypothetical protein
MLRENAHFLDELLRQAAAAATDRGVSDWLRALADSEETATGAKEQKPTTSAA